jgi:hypothetical protein
MKTGKTARHGAWLVAAWLSCGTALAAGGHHDVDDAAILDPGECELESWLSRARNDARVVHAGANCRVGPVELGLASEYGRQDGNSETAWGLEVKWAGKVSDAFSIGVKLAPAWGAQSSPHYEGAALIGLATWEARDDLSLHLNVGREFVHRDEDANRYGAAVEWMPLRTWSLLAERYKERDAHFARAGVRWLGGEHWSIDVGRSFHISGPRASAWTVGATFQFDRK